MMKEKSVELPDEWIGEIPVAPSIMKARIVCLGSIMLLGLGLLIKWVAPFAMHAFLDANAAIAIVFQETRTTELVSLCFDLFVMLSAVCAISGAVGLLKLRIGYHFIKASLAVVYMIMALYVWALWLGVSALMNVQGLEIAGLPQTRSSLLELWCALVWPAVAIAIYTLWLHIMMKCRSVYAIFTSEKAGPMVGDLFLENLRTHGQDARYRRSSYASFMTHLAVLIVIPFLMSLGGCVTSYKLPPGSGEPVVAEITVVPPKPQVKESLTLRPNSAMSINQPDLDKSEVDQQMEEQTQIQYQAMANAKAGKMGKGGGTKGGWPEGMEDYKIRFIRLEHGGSGWDDGMNDTGADINFLRGFAQSTGFKKIASRGESHSIALLRKYPKDGFPPFVYLTGNGNMGRVSSTDPVFRDRSVNQRCVVSRSGGHPAFRHALPRGPERCVAPDHLFLEPIRCSPVPRPAPEPPGAAGAAGTVSES